MNLQNYTQVHPCKCSKQGWIEVWAIWSNEKCPFSRQGVGIRFLKSLPTQSILRHKNEKVHKEARIRSDNQAFKSPVQNYTKPLVIKNTYETLEWYIQLAWSWNKVTFSTRMPTIFLLPACSIKRSDLAGLLRKGDQTTSLLHCYGNTNTNRAPPASTGSSHSPLKSTTEHEM